MMNPEFKQEKKVKVELILSESSNVTVEQIEDFFSTELNEEVIASVEEISYYSEVLDEGSVSTRSSTGYKKAYEHTAREFTGNEDSEERCKGSYYCNVRGNRGKYRYLNNDSPPSVIYSGLSDYSEELEEEELDSDIFGEEETIGTTDSTRSKDTNQSDLSFAVSDESIGQISYVRRFVENNDKQDLRLLSAKRNAQDSLGEEGYEKNTKRTRFE